MGIWTPFPIMVVRRPAPAFMATAMTAVTGLIVAIAAIPTIVASAGAMEVAAMVAVVIAAAVIAAAVIAAAVIAATATVEVVIAVPKAGPAERRL